MIVLHRITHPEHEIRLNPSMIQSVEATPDTVISLDNHTKFVVIETPHEVTALMRSWKASVLAEALREAGGSRLDQAAAGAAEVLRLPTLRP
jgi:flagellar protein FlbD